MSIVALRKPFLGLSAESASMLAAFLVGLLLSVFLVSSETVRMVVPLHMSLMWVPILCGPVYLGTLLLFDLYGE